MKTKVKGKWISELISLVPWKEGWRCSYCGTKFAAIPKTPLESGIFYCPSCGDKKTQEVYIET